MNKIYLPDDFGFGCTKLSAKLTGLPLDIFVYTSVYKIEHLNLSPFVLYYYENAILPFFFDNRLNQGKRPPVVCFWPEENGEYQRHEVYRWQKVSITALLPVQTRECLSAYITKHQEVLLAYWSDRIDSLELLNALGMSKGRGIYAVHS